MGHSPHRDEEAGSASSRFAQVEQPEAAYTRDSSARGAGYLKQYPPDIEALTVLGERMLRSARLHRRPLSLLVLQVADLPELEILFGRDAANQVVQVVMKELSGLAGRPGLTLRTEPDIFALLLPHCTGELLERALRARLGRACSIELDFDDEEIVLVPDVKASTVPDGESIESTYRVLRRALESRQYLEQVRRDHLRREREAHSTHMGLSPELSQRHAARTVRSGTGWCATLPATIAMPLGGSPA